jgi:acetyl esterase/lipase
MNRPIPMIHHSLAAFRRLALSVAVLLAAALPAAAQITIFSPFNVPGTIDEDIRKQPNVPYADGDRKKLDIYAPKEQDGLAPVVMFIYGGAWRAGDKFEYEFAGRALAANGFIAVVPDYRVGSSIRYPQFLQDNAEAMKWIEDNIATYGGDKSRFFLAGHSAGAYNSVMLALDSSFRREYGVTMPIRAVAGISGPYNFYPFEYNEVRETFGGAPNPEGTQPINLITPEAPPMLLASGTKDPIVRVENSRAMADRLRSHGVWVTEKYYDGFGHLEPVIAMGQLWRWRMPVLADVVEFFSRFGAFPSGVARPVYTPEPPVTERDPMTALIESMDAILAPISDGERGAD